MNILRSLGSRTVLCDDSQKPITLILYAVISATINVLHCCNNQDRKVVLLTMCFSRSVMSNSLQHQGQWPQAPLFMGILQARILVWVAILSSRGIFPTQGLNPGLPHFQTDSLPSETPWKPTSHHIDALYLVTYLFQLKCRVKMFILSKNKHADKFKSIQSVWAFHLFAGCSVR